MVVNGEYVAGNEGLLLGSLLEKLQLHEKKGLAVAVNNAVVAKSNWGTYFLKEEDRITIIRATQGG